MDRGAWRATVHGVTKSRTQSEQGLEGQEALGALERAQGREEVAAGREAGGHEQEGERFPPKGLGGLGQAEVGELAKASTRGAALSQIIDSFHVVHSLAPIPTTKLFQVSTSQ